MVFIIIAILAIIFLILWACIDIVPQAEARVIERLGVFHAVWNAGIHVKIPVLDRAVIPHIDLREQVLELPRTYSDGIETTSSFQTQSDSNSTSRSTHTNDYYGAAASTSGSVNNFGVVRASVNAKGNTTLTSKIFGLRENSRFNFNSKVYDSGLSARYSDFRDVITKDNVRMEIDAAVFYQVTDPKQYAYGMKQPLFALQKLTITTLRNIIGTLELDETLCSRDLINTKLRATLDESTDSWGIKITRVEIESILPPPDIQDAMEQQAKAERAKRARILEAEGYKQSEILKAEGDKQAKIHAAEAEKQRVILEAQAAEQAAILTAKGEAEALLEMKEAEAKSLKMLNDNAPSDSVIRLKAIQGMEKVAEGNATKIIIPSEMQGLVGLANGLTEGVTPNTAPVVK